MKRLIKYIAAALMASASISCVIEDPFMINETVEEGVPVTLKLDFVSTSKDTHTIVTKGGDNHDINDLYIFIFSSDNGKPGVLKNKLYTTDLEKEDAKVANDKGENASSTSTRVTTPIQTTTGESFIFAFANISEAFAPAEYNVEALKGQLDALEPGTKCFDDLMNVSISLKAPEATVLQRVTDLYLMAGLYQKTGEYTRGLTPCMINRSGTLSEGNIRMYRLDARVDFKIKSDTSSDSKGTFVPTSWRLFNVPLKSRLMTTAYGSGEDFDGKSPLYTTDEAVAENYWNTPYMKIDASGSEYTFSLNLLENRKEPTAAGQEIEKWEYRHRETMNPLADTDGDLSNKGNTHSFKYAPKYATYIELEGYFSGTTEYPFGSAEKDGKKHEITATTQFRIHLGDFGSNVNGKTYDNFNTLRNYHYTYTITVKGVEQILVEVNSDDEDLDDLDTPGVNGVVSYVPSNHHRVDSHFETRSIRIKKSDLEDWTEDDFRYLAQTCYGDYEGTKDEETPEHDIYWVEFVLTHKQGKDGKWRSWATGTGKDIDNLPESGRVGKHPSYMSYQSAKKRGKDNPTEGKTMYAHEFLKDLWDWKTAPVNTSDNVHYNIQEKVYTVFIKENYYSAEDIAKFQRQKNTSGNSDENHWKDFCNQPDRVLYIGMRKIESGETESAIMENVCVTRQRSIQTIYNTDHKHDGDLTSAWGIETVDELKGTLTEFDVVNGVSNVPKDASGAQDDFTKDVTHNTYYFNKENGYIAQYYFLWQGRRMYTTGTAAEKPETLWDTYVNPHTHDLMKNDNVKKNDHNHAFLQCLRRNKDVDGDGFIDPGEIRWYLPAVNQLGDIFIGERGIDPEATLYYGQNTWNHDYQYLTATIRNEANNYTQYKMLAEEGFAYNTSDDRPKYNLRCVRNLGVNGDLNYSEGFYDKNSISNSKTLLLATYKPPQQYVIKDEDSRTMDLTFLNDNAKRGFVNTELTAEHTERSDENQLYNKFQWADGRVTASHPDPIKKGTYIWFSADEVAYGERRNNSMRTLTRAYLYPNDIQDSVQTASQSPKQGWRAPNQKELMLLHFHANGFSANSLPHTCNQGDGGNKHEGYSGKNWFFCRTVFSYSGVKANRAGRTWTDNWVTDASFVKTPDTGGISTTQNEGNYYRVDKNNECPSADPTNFANYRYAFGIQHNGTGFGLLFLDWYLQGNTNTKNCLLVPVRDVR